MVRAGVGDAAHRLRRGCRSPLLRTSSGDGRRAMRSVSKRSSIQTPATFTGWWPPWSTCRSRTCGPRSPSEPRRPSSSTRGSALSQPVRLRTLGRTALCAGCSPGSPISTSRRFTSGSTPPGFCGSWPTPAATSSGNRLADRACRGWAVVPDRAIHGNLDPALLLGPFDAVTDQALWILDQCGRSAGACLQPRPRRLARDRPGPPTAPCRCCPRSGCAVNRVRRPTLPRFGHHTQRQMTDAILLMAYGSPDRLDQVEAYSTGYPTGQPATASTPRGVGRGAIARSAAARRCHG